MEFHEQHAIVTGGSSGIGRALARLLTRRGAHVSIVARRQELLDETLAELEGLRKDTSQRLMAYSADLADWEQARQAITALTQDLAPDLLINAAGFAHPGYVEELGIDIFHRTMDADYFGTLHPIKAALPAMMEQRSGHIVNFSSMAGYMAVFGYTAYGAAKFAVRGFSDVLRQELKPHGIHVSVVFPPDTDTPQLHYENQFKPLETRRISGNAKAMTADEVAEVTVRGIERKRSYILPGFEAKVTFLLSDGLGGIFRWYMDRIVAKVARERKAA